MKKFHQMREKFHSHKTSVAQYHETRDWPYEARRRFHRCTRRESPSAVGVLERGQSSLGMHSTLLFQTLPPRCSFDLFGRSRTNFSFCCSARKDYLPSFTEKSEALNISPLKIIMYNNSIYKVVVYMHGTFIFILRPRTKESAYRHEKK